MLIGSSQTMLENMILVFIEANSEIHVNFHSLDFKGKQTC